MLSTKLIASVAIVSSLGLTACTPAANGPVRKTKQQQVSLVVLPPIAQAGKGPASPDSAKSALVATVRPAAPGNSVALQAQTGSAWTTLATARQNEAGRAEFQVKLDPTVSYRARASRTDFLPAAEGAPVTETPWANPTWTDEFKGRKLNPAWVPRGQDYSQASRRACSKGDPRAVKVQKGTLRLSILKDPSRKRKCTAQKGDGPKGKYAYRLSGHIGTINTFSFKYGVAAARIKMQPQRGQHASFWMQPVGENVPGTAGQEIDVIEYFGDRHPRGGLTSFTHTYEGQELVKTGSWLKKPTSFLKGKRDSWSKNYHVFSVQWTPKVLIFRIDGKETWRTSRYVSKQDQYLILSLLASDYELPEMKDAQLPQHMYVDWVRVWETGPPVR